jgi:hypothetical protein
MASLPTLKQVRDSHTWKQDYEKYMPLSRFFYRPLGFLLTWGAIRIGATTEMVSYLSAVIGVLGCLLLTCKYQSCLFIGIIALHFFNLLDCVDGSIARAMKTENPYGKFLDSVLGDLVDFGFFFCISIMAFRHPNLLKWSSPFNQDVMFWLLIGCSTAFFYIFLRHIELLFEYQIYSAELKISGSRSNEDQIKDKFGTSHYYMKGKGADWKGILRLLDRNLRVRETIYAFLLIAFLLNLIDLFLFAYFVYFLFHIGISCSVYFLRAKRLRDI